MPGFILNSRQIRKVIDMIGLGEPVEGSPLQFLPQSKVPLHPDDPAFTELTDKHILELDEEDGWRVNKFFAVALKACVSPEEVISVGISQQGQPGICVARLGPLWCECTVSRDWTKFYFPLTRSMVIFALTQALSGDAPEQESTGFHFVGSAEDAFVMATVMRELREYPVSLSIDTLRHAVARAATVPGFSAPFTVFAGPDAIERLAKSPVAVEAAIKRLAAEGHLQVVDGNVEPSAAASAALGDDPVASFGVQRTEIGEKGPASQSMLVIRAGGRNLVFRTSYAGEKSPRFEWIEMNRQQLRSMVTATLLPAEDLALAMQKPSKEPPSAEKIIPPPLPPEVQIQPDKETQWFYIKDLQTFGPMDEVQIKRLLKERVLNSKTFVWNESMPDWQKAYDVGLARKPRKAPTRASSAPAIETVIHCSECGRELRKTAKFCPKCGTPVTKKASAKGSPTPKTAAVTRCQQCGKELRSGAKFCPKCGAVVKGRA